MWNSSATRLRWPWETWETLMFIIRNTIHASYHLWYIGCTLCDLIIRYNLFVSKEHQNISDIEARTVLRHHSPYSMSFFAQFVAAFLKHFHRANLPCIIVGLTIILQIAAEAWGHMTSDKQSSLNITIMLAHKPMPTHWDVTKCKLELWKATLRTLRKCGSGARSLILHDIFRHIRHEMYIRTTQSADTALVVRKSQVLTSERSVSHSLYCEAMQVPAWGEQH